VFGTLAIAMTVRDESRGRSSAKALLLAAQRGDAAAQAEIFDTHRLQVARQVHRMTGDPAAVDDLVQEVFIAAFTALSAFRGEAQLQTWLHTITVNKVRNWWDSRKRRRVREARAAHEPLTSSETPEDHIEASEHRRRLYEALGDLPDALREAFTLRAIERMSLKEASAVLGAPVSTVSYRTRRAEKLLCEALDIPWKGEA
jgi:RNA polymerase sigma-70 factor (ECF subfamily)